MRQAIQLTRRILATLAAMCWALIMDVALKMALLTGKSKNVEETVRFAVKGLCWICTNFFGAQILIDPKLKLLAQNQERIIVVSNHYSPLDMPLIMSAFSQKSVKFISRAGLDRWVPFVSCYIRHCGCMTLHLDKTKNIEKLDRFGQALQDEGGVAVIFPEGRKITSNYASLIKFKKGGLNSLMKAAPTAKVIPVVIHGTHQFWRGGIHLPKLDIKISISLLRQEDYRETRDKSLTLHYEERIRLALQRRMHTDKTPALFSERRCS